MKPFSEIPGLTVREVVFGLLQSDQRKSLENNALLWETYGDMVKIEIPFRPPILLLYDPELCEKVYRASGSQPIRPGFDALRY